MHKPALLDFESSLTGIDNRSVFLALVFDSDFSETVRNVPGSVRSHILVNIEIYA